jgi:hypothetical protein
MPEISLMTLHCKILDKLIALNQTALPVTFLNLSKRRSLCIHLRTVVVPSY